jgi:large subunit ribosomal protein L4
LALRKALTERLKAGDVQVVADLKLGSPKTKGFTAILSKLDVKGTALLVDAVIDNNVRLASRNVEGVEVTTADNVNTYQVLRPNKVLITKSAFEKLEARLKN